MSEDQEWSRRILRAGLGDRVRARGSRLPLAHVLGRRCDAAVLRLGRVRGAVVRRRRGVQGGAVEGRRRLRAGRGRVALENGPAALDPVRGRLRAREVRGPPARAATPRFCLPQLKSRLSAYPDALEIVVRIRDCAGLSGATALEAAFVAAILAAFVVVVAPTLGQPLLERHAFRQTQTAYTARIFHEQGIDLIHPKLPVLGEPFEVPFEFPLFQAAASLVMDVGVRDDVAMRLTGPAVLPPDGAPPLRPRPPGGRAGQRRSPRSSPSSRRRSRSCGVARR